MVTSVLLGLAALIYAVLFVIACVALAIGSTAVTASISGDSSGAAVLGMSWAVVIFMIVLVVAVFALVFVYFGSVLNTIGRVKYTARTGKAGQPVSMFLIVMNFILFVFGLLGFAVNFDDHALCAYRSSLPVWCFRRSDSDLQLYRYAVAHHPAADLSPPDAACAFRRESAAFGLSSVRKAAYPGFSCGNACFC